MLRSRHYTPAHEDFRKTVRRFMERECAPNREAWQTDGKLPRDLWLKAGEAGLLCTKVSSDFGGGGGDLYHAMIILEEQTRIGFNEITFDDAAGKEVVYIQAQRNLSKLVKANENERTGQNRAIFVGPNRSAFIGTNDNVTVGQRSVAAMVEFKEKDPNKPNEPTMVLKDTMIETIHPKITLTTGKDHWHVLLRARAIENQVFVLAAAQHGKHPKGRQTYGKSVIVDPWGDVIAQCSEGEGFALARLDFAYQDRVRASLPALNHRRI